MGSEVRLLIGPPAERGTCRRPRRPRRAHRRGSRTSTAASRAFAPTASSAGSTPTRATEVEASPLLRRVVAAALWAAEHTDGLVDPTLIDRLEQRGYAGLARRSRARRTCRRVRRRRPPRRPAAPDPRARWRSVSVDDERGTIRRPPGLRLDSGGVGKGSRGPTPSPTLLEGYSRFLVDCGGDIRVGGPDALDAAVLGPGREPRVPPHGVLVPLSARARSRRRESTCGSGATRTAGSRTT